MESGMVDGFAKWVGKPQDESPPAESREHGRSPRSWSIFISEIYHFHSKN